ncbi:MAG: hypothetical protein HRU41_36400 [Saprospiraceae bacterium]|nr:hypothetical protein [Saprospiraceae bacterium]
MDQVQQYIIPWSIGIICSLIVLFLCIKKPFYGRRLLALLFLLGTLANVYLAWIYPRDYLVFGRFTWLDSYRHFIYMILFRQAMWMGGILVALHAYLAYTFWQKGPLPRVASFLAIFLLLLLVPLGFGSAFPASLLLLIGVVYLSRDSMNLTEA